MGTIKVFQAILQMFFTGERSERWFSLFILQIYLAVHQGGCNTPTNR